MNDEHALSPTQIESFLRCPRKWAWRKIEGLERPDDGSRATSLGTAVHEQLERWLSKGEGLDLSTEAGALALQALPYLPAPGTPGLVCEGYFTVELAGHRIRGFKDASITPAPGAVPVVYDHKTTASIDRWAKRPEALRTDPQAVIYAADAMLRARADACDLQWTYIQTRGKAVAPVRVRLTRAEIAPALEGIKVAANAMRAARLEGRRALDLAPNPLACSDFGGCEYAPLCTDVTATERMVSKMNQAMNAQPQAGYMALLDASRAGVQTNPGAPPGAINPPPVATQTPIQGPDGRWFVGGGAQPWVEVAPPAPIGPPAPMAGGVDGQTWNPNVPPGGAWVPSAPQGAVTSVQTHVQTHGTPAPNQNPTGIVTPVEPARRGRKPKAAPDGAAVVAMPADAIPPVPGLMAIVGRIADNEEALAAAATGLDQIGHAMHSFATALRAL